MFVRQVTFAVLLAVAANGFHVDQVQQRSSDTKGSPNPAERKIEYWYNSSLERLTQRLNTPMRNGLAKNIIFFLGDGMSIATITAARIYKGQLNNETGEEGKLSFEKFPFTGLSKTYCVNSQVADSACSGTAFLSGVKGNYKTIGVTADVQYRDWQAMRNATFNTPSILQWAQEAKKATGVVTTCSVTDATPSAAYAHTASREWQTDVDIQADAPDAFGVMDIASQLIENSPGKNIKVVLGGGRQTFLPKYSQDEYGFNGTRGDKRNLVDMWKSAKKSMNASASYVTSRDQLLKVNISSTDYLMGLFQPGNLNYHLLANSSFQPTLSEMTRTALKMLQKEKNGYFLLVEGGEIDLGHHENLAHIALDETVEFHKAIELAVNMTSEDDTLIIVTADHAHTMSINGYPARGSDIITSIQNTKDNISYSTLSYANGPNRNRFNDDRSQHDIAKDDRADPKYSFPTIYNLTWETHDGQDVAVYARGPSAHLLVGTFEQSYIPHVLAYAAGIGPAANQVPRGASGSWSVAPSGLLVASLFALALIARSQ